jgi:hypothetical protein
LEPHYLAAEKSQERRWCAWQEGCEVQAFLYGGYCALGYNPGKLPTNVTADLYFRINGEEYLAGKATASKGDQHIQLNIDGITGHSQPFKHADLILRPNERLARETVDMYEMWGGVIVKEGIEVECLE